MKLFSFFIFCLLCLISYTELCHGERGKNPLQELLRARKLRKKQANYYNTEEDDRVSNKISLPVYVGPQVGRKQADKIDCLPGQPPVKFSQYSGYVTVDPQAGRVLFYYFAEAVEDSSTKPLVLWLNGGPGCSSLGYGAMTELGPFRVNPDGKSLCINEYAWNKGEFLTELGPFRVNPDGKSLSYNKYAWNIVSNVIFLESPAGVGFSYSNKSSDYVTGDKQTAWDSYTFIVNWLERFLEYKSRYFFIAGKGYAGHYVPQLAQLILQQNNKNPKNSFINLKGIAIGNAIIDDLDADAGIYDHLWTSALISDETHQAIKTNCNFSPKANDTDVCDEYQDKAFDEIGNIDIYNIYAPLCDDSSPAAPPSISNFDPCSENYVSVYLNNPEAQKRLHANITRSLPGPWQACSEPVNGNWTDGPNTTLPVIRKLMASGIRVWIYSGDTDGVIPVTTTIYSMPKLRASVVTPWYPWYCQGEVGGYVVGYENVTFVTVRGAGHAAPSYQPQRSLTLFSSFLQGKLPPGHSN